MKLFGDLIVKVCSTFVNLLFNSLATLALSAGFFSGRVLEFNNASEKRREWDPVSLTPTLKTLDGKFRVYLCKLRLHCMLFTTPNLDRYSASVKETPLCYRLRSFSLSLQVLCLEYV